MNRILDLRAKAQDELGDRFDFGLFHDVVLGDGQVPLPVLEGMVEAWIDERR